MITLTCNGVRLVIGDRSEVVIDDGRGCVDTMEARSIGVMMRRRLRARADQMVAAAQAAPEAGPVNLVEIAREPALIPPVDVTCCGQYQAGDCKMDSLVCDGQCGEHAARAPKEAPAADRLEIVEPDPAQAGGLE